jgi:hypothetical protein
MNEPETMSAAVCEIIDRYPVGHQFHGNELRDDVVRIYPESQHQYVDTILRMARRHRRGAFRVVDRNNSLYEKVPYESIELIIEEIRERAQKEEQPERKPGQATQGLLFAQLFFFFFFSGLAFEGRPLPGESLMASKSSLVYKASCEKGLRPALRRRLLTVSFGNLSLSAISEIVIPSIPHIIGILRKKLRNVHIREHLLYMCIVKNRKKANNVHKKGYFLLTICSFIWTI